MGLGVGFNFLFTIYTLLGCLILSFHRSDFLFLKHDSILHHFFLLSLFSTAAFVLLYHFFLLCSSWVNRHYYSTWTLLAALFSSLCSRRSTYERTPYATTMHSNDESKRQTLLVQTANNRFLLRSQARLNHNTSIHRNFVQQGRCLLHRKFDIGIIAYVHIHRWHRG